MTRLVVSLFMFRCVRETWCFFQFFVIFYQDRKDLDFALQVPGGVDIVALSFVQKPGDVQELKDIVQGRCRVMAKIEKPQAVHDLDEIVALCDAIMVARCVLCVRL